MQIIGQIEVYGVTVEGVNMADENQANEQGNQMPNVDETLKNLKSEFSRKQENVSKELEQIKAMLGNLAQPQRQQAAEPNEIPDPVLDPKGYKEYLKKEVLQETSQIVNQNNQRQSQLASLVQSYPELQDSNSELTKKAVENYSRLSNEEKMSPRSYQFAVQDAAAELGVLPVSKRQNNKNNDGDDSFTANSGAYSSNKPSQKQNRNSDKIDDATLAFAQAIGKDVNDPKYIESLKKHTNRKNWNRGQ